MVDKKSKHYCDKGSRYGACCCNCAWKIQVNKHLMNIIAKGRITEKFANVCLNTYEDDSGTPIIMEWEHGICEYWKEK